MQPLQRIINPLFKGGVGCLLLLLTSQQAAAIEPQLKAQLIAERFTDIAAGISSLVRKIDVKNGELVKQGTSLVVFDCDTLQASAVIARAHVSAASAKFDSLFKLFKLRSASALEVTLATSEKMMAEAELTSVNAQVKHCEITAPYKSRIVERYIQPYQYVEPGTPLMHIYDPDSLGVQFVAPSSGLLQLRKNKSFSIHLDELNLELTGKIVRTSGKIDPVSQTIQVYGELDSHPVELLEGMSGFVTLQP